jgi:hypothetical protein
MRAALYVVRALFDYVAAWSFWPLCVPFKSWLRIWILSTNYYGRYVRTKRSQRGMDRNFYMGRIARHAHRAPCASTCW